MLTALWVAISVLAFWLYICTKAIANLGKTTEMQTEYIDSVRELLGLLIDRKDLLGKLKDRDNYLKALEHDIHHTQH